MRIPSHVRTLLFTLLLLSPIALSAQSATPADAKAFLGSWSVSVDAGAGPIELTLNLKEAAGKVGGDIGGGDIPVTAFDEVTKKGASLVMKYSADVGGAMAAITLTADAAGDKLSLTFDVAGQTLPATGTKKP